MTSNLLLSIELFKEFESLLFFALLPVEATSWQLIGNWCRPTSLSKFWNDELFCIGSYWHLLLPLGEDITGMLFMSNCQHHNITCFAQTSSDQWHFIGKSPNIKTCGYPVPTWIIKKLPGTMAPIIADIINRSIALSASPACFHKGGLGDPNLENTVIGPRELKKNQSYL